jgi:hypothetical protein
MSQAAGNDIGTGKISQHIALSNLWRSIFKAALSSSVNAPKHHLCTQNPLSQCGTTCHAWPSTDVHRTLSPVYYLPEIQILCTLLDARSLAACSAERCTCSICALQGLAVHTQITSQCQRTMALAATPQHAAQQVGTRVMGSRVAGMDMETQRHHLSAWCQPRPVWSLRTCVCAFPSQWSSSAHVTAVAVHLCRTREYSHFANNHEHLQMTEQHMHTPMGLQPRCWQDVKPGSGSTTHVFALVALVASSKDITTCNTDWVIPRSITTSNINIKPCHLLSQHKRSWLNYSCDKGLSTPLTMSSIGKTHGPMFPTCTHKGGLTGCVSHAATHVRSNTSFPRRTTFVHPVKFHPQVPGHIKLRATQSVTASPTTNERTL